MDSDQQVLGRGANLAVQYHDGVTAVRPGDQIRAKMLFFWTLEGVVMHVPGVSPPRKEMVFNGIRYVGVKAADGDLYSLQVHPDTARLKKSVTFIARGPDPGELGEDESFFSEDE